MKKCIAAIVLALGATAVVAAPSQAVSCNAFNQGTYTAVHGDQGNREGHSQAWDSPGLWKLAMACH